MFVYYSHPPSLSKDDLLAWNIIINMMVLQTPVCSTHVCVFLHDTSRCFLASHYFTVTLCMFVSLKRTRCKNWLLHLCRCRFLRCAELVDKPPPGAKTRRAAGGQRYPTSARARAFRELAPRVLDLTTPHLVGTFLGHR